MKNNDKYALLMELANLMIQMGHEIKGLSLDPGGVCLESFKGETEVRFWVTIAQKKNEDQG